MRETKEKIEKKEQSLRDLWDRPCIYVTRILKGVEKEIVAEKNAAGSFSNLVKVINVQI